MSHMKEKERQLTILGNYDISVGGQLELWYIKTIDTTVIKKSAQSKTVKFRTVFVSDYRGFLF